MALVKDGVDVSGGAAPVKEWLVTLAADDEVKITCFVGVSAAVFSQPDWLFLGGRV